MAVRSDPDAVFNGHGLDSGFWDGGGGGGVICERPTSAGSADICPGCTSLAVSLWLIISAIGPLSILAAGLGCFMDQRGETFFRILSRERRHLHRHCLQSNQSAGEKCLARFHGLHNARAFRVTGDRVFGPFLGQGFHDAFADGTSAGESFCARDWQRLKISSAWGSLSRPQT